MGAESVKSSTIEPRARIEETSFNFKSHLEKLKRDGILKSKAGKLETKRWDPKEYLEETFESIVNGGFSYFLYKGEPHETEFMEGVTLRSKERVLVRDKEPLLMKDEKLEKIADIRWEANPDLNAGERWGPLYYTGRRFIIDTVSFKAQAWHGQEIEFSLPLNSYWIKPDYSDLLDALDMDFFFEDGVFRKKKYNRLAFNLIEVKKPRMLAERGVQCGYMLDGPDGEYLWTLYHYLYNLNEESIDGFADRIEDLTSRAKATSVSDLIKHTCDCQCIEGAIIESSLFYSSKRLSDKPCSLTGYWTRFV